MIIFLILTLLITKLTLSHMYVTNYVKVFKKFNTKKKGIVTFCISNIIIVCSYHNWRVLFYGMLFKLKCFRLNSILNDLICG